DGPHPSAQSPLARQGQLDAERVVEDLLPQTHDYPGVEPVLAGDRDTLGEQPVLPCGGVELEARLDLRGGDVGHAAGTFRQWLQAPPVWCIGGRSMRVDGG